MLEILNVSFTLGLVYAIMALGVVISFRIMDFPDLTIDGSFVLGASIVAKLATIGCNPIISTLLSFACGFIAGCCTGILNTKFKISKLLSGILMMIMLYSINLRIMGRPNMPLLNVNTLTNIIESVKLLNGFEILIFFLAIVALIKLLSDYFLFTEWGTILRATGDNEQVVKNIGVNTDLVKIAGLGLSNALIAFSGSLVAQYQGFADIGMGIGMIVIGVASIIIGEGVTDRIGIIKRRFSLVWRRTSSAIFGAIIYQLFITLGLRLGLAPTDLKLATGIMVVIFLGIHFRRKEELEANIVRY